MDEETFCSTTPPWRALPVTYHLGPGAAKVHLKLAFDWNIVPSFNVIARLKGWANQTNG